MFKTLKYYGDPAHDAIILKCNTGEHKMYCYETDFHSQKKGKTYC